MVLACAVPAAANPEQTQCIPVDAVLEDARGRRVSLSRWRGKPLVLFYEDHRSTGLNQPLKDELFRRGTARGLLGSASVVAVASLKAFDRWPVKGFAQRGVADAERTFRVPVLIDWCETLAGGQLRLPASGASVVLLDAQGAVRFRRTGALSAQDREELFQQLADLLGVEYSR
ncbi:MAG: hypothetical protein RL653_4449 [Pseudomonadota bacterium]|jgi:hypothetical protein